MLDISSFTLLILKIIYNPILTSCLLWDLKFLGNILTFWWDFSDGNRAAFSLGLLLFSALWRMPLDALWRVSLTLWLWEQPAWFPRTGPHNPFGIPPPPALGIFLTYACWVPICCALMGLSADFWLSLQLSPLQILVALASLKAQL